MKYIKPSNRPDLKIIVDDDLYEEINEVKWTACKYKDGSVYLKANLGLGGIWFLHRILVGALPGEIVDHINGSCQDNRKENLRIVTKQQNNTNKSIRKNKTSSNYKGVYPIKVKGTEVNRWRAYICVDRKQIYLGSFKREIDAAKTYDLAAIKYHGNFARLNFQT